MADYNSAYTGAQIDENIALAATATQPGDLGTAAFTASTAYATAAQGTLAGTAVQPAAIANMLVSNITGITGADAITNTVSLTAAEYAAIGTKSATTLYVIAG